MEGGIVRASEQESGNTSAERAEVKSGAAERTQ